MHKDIRVFVTVKSKDQHGDQELVWLSISLMGEFLALAGNHVASASGMC